MKFLNSKERKEFFRELEEEYGYGGSKDYVIAEGGKGKYYIISRDVDKILFEEMGMKQGGLYVAARMKDGLRLTMDGAMMLGPSCKKERVKLTSNEKDAWMNGENVVYRGEEHGYVIVAWKEDILGCGKIMERIVLNYVPKERRIAEPHPSNIPRKAALDRV